MINLYQKDTKSILNIPISKKKDYFLKKVKQILSDAPSILGYRCDIIMLMNELNITLDDYFLYIVDILNQNNFRESIINEDKDIYYLKYYAILGYLIFMKELIKRFQYESKSNILENLRYFVNNINYILVEKNTILYRFGEKSKNSLLLLNGQVTYLTKEKKSIKISENDYLIYLSNLLFKNYEIGLFNETIYENIKKYPLIIINDLGFDSDENIELYEILQLMNDNMKKIKNELETSENQIKPKNLSITELYTYLDYESNYINDNTINGESKDNINNYKSKSSKNVNNNDKPSASSIKIFNRQKSSRYLRKFMNKIINSFYKENENPKKVISIDEYINSINNLVKNKDYSKDQNDKEAQIQKGVKILHLKIFNYKIDSEKSTGYLIGDAALKNISALRSNTVITNSTCHLSLLDKKLFFNISMTALRKTNEVLQFITSINIMNNISFSILRKMYYTMFFYETITKFNFIIKQNSIPLYVYLLKTGKFEITWNVSLKCLTNYLIYLYELTGNVNNQANFVKESEENCLKIMKENLKFKKFYFQKETVKIREIECPDIIGLNDNISSDGKYLFNIECKSDIGEYYKINIKNYETMENKIYSLKYRQQMLLNFRYDFLIQRLNTIRTGKIQSFFNYMSRSNLLDLQIKVDFHNDLIKSKYNKNKKCLKNTIPLKLFNANNKNEEENNACQNIIEDHNSNCIQGTVNRYERHYRQKTMDNINFKENEDKKIRINTLNSSDNKSINLITINKFKNTNKNLMEIFDNPSFKLIDEKLNSLYSKNKPKNRNIQINNNEIKFALTDTFKTTDNNINDLSIKPPPFKNEFIRKNYIIINNNNNDEQNSSDDDDDNNNIIHTIYKNEICQCENTITPPTNKDDDNNISSNIIKMHYKINSISKTENTHNNSNKNINTDKIHKNKKTIKLNEANSKMNYNETISNFNFANKYTQNTTMNKKKIVFSNDKINTNSEKYINLKLNTLTNGNDNYNSNNEIKLLENKNLLKTTSSSDLNSSCNENKFIPLDKDLDNLKSLSKYNLPNKNINYNKMLSSQFNYDVLVTDNTLSSKRLNNNNYNSLNSKFINDKFYASFNMFRKNRSKNLIYKSKNYYTLKSLDKIRNISLHKNKYIHNNNNHIIMENNNNTNINNHIEIEKYNLLKREKYDKERNVYLAKTMNRINYAMGKIIRIKHKSKDSVVYS